MNWKKFHFFKQPDGLSKNDSLEMRVCLDYEQALECKPLIELVCGLDRQQRKRMLNQALRFRGDQFVLVDAGPRRSVEGSKAMRSFPKVPAACVAASWFPKNWLSGPRSERRTVVDQIRSLYINWSFPMFDFSSIDAETARILRCEWHTNLYVIAIDPRQTKSALLQGFETAIDETAVTGTLSRKGKVNIPAQLNDLGIIELCIVQLF